MSDHAIFLNGIQEAVSSILSSSTIISRVYENNVSPFFMDFYSVTQI